MFYKLIVALAILAGLGGFAGVGSAAPIALNQWYTFGFAAADSTIFGDCGTCVLGVDPISLLAPAGPWTFISIGSAGLFVTDGYSPVDQFDIFDNGVDLGPTSPPNVTGLSCGNDITACLADPDISQGAYLLDAGFHSITGTVVLSPFGTGAAFFEVVGTPPGGGLLPEPTSLALLGIGIAALGAFGRRTRAVNPRTGP